MKPPKDDVLLIQFSGGLTSALMVKLVLRAWKDGHKDYVKYKQVIVVFCNTGKEREETLEFVEQCDKAFGWHVVWLEAVIRPNKRDGTRFRIVNFKTAHRGNALFEALCAKYGLPSKEYPHCTRELKENVVRSYARFLGIKATYALGMRADELGRVNRKKSRIYPLAHHFPLTKFIVRNHWAGQPFTLRLSEHEGNCDLCFKKSLRKKLTLVQDRPEVAKPWQDLEEKYGDPDNDRDQFNARDRIYIRDLIRKSTENFERFTPEQLVYDATLDVDSACVCG